MRYLSAWLAIFMAFSAMPGSVELVADAAAAIARDADAADADHPASSADRDGEPRSTESGCSGTQHVCGCHHSPAFVSAPATAVAAAPAAGASSSTPEPVDAAPSPIAGRLFRPPIAA